jgi:hypothetical protein
MAGKGRTDARAAKETGSESRATPFEGCVEWLEKMRGCFENRAAGPDCCEGMRRACCDEPETKENE